MDTVRNQVKLLIDILRDPTATATERDDAVTYLGDYGDPLAAAELLKIATNSEEDEVLAATAAESLAEVWVALGEFDTAGFKRLTGVRRAEAIAVLERDQPKWLEEVRRTAA